MRNKVIAALVAGGLLVGAGFVTSIVSAPGTASAQETEAGTDEARGFFSPWSRVSPGGSQRPRE